MRAFVAIPADPALQSALARAQARLQERGARLRWVAPQNLHLTLKFLGEVDEGTVPALIARLEGACQGVSPVRLPIGQVVPFPSARRLRLLAASVTGVVPPGLVDLAARLDSAFEDLGVPAEGRPFKAHLTLGRVRSPQDARAALGALGREVAAREGPLGVLPVEAVVLVQSVLGPGGPRYAPVHRVPLAGSAPAASLSEGRSAIDTATGTEPRIVLQDVRLRALGLQRAPRLPGNATVEEGLELMRKTATGAILIVDEQGALLGIFTARDVLTRVAGRTAEVAGVRLSRVMTPDPERLGLDDPMGKAVAAMAESGHQHLPVQDPDSGDWSVLCPGDVVRWAAGGRSS